MLLNYRDLIEMVALSMKRGRQSIEGYAHDGDLSVDRCARHESDGNRTQDTKIYIGFGRQHDVKPYILCSVILY
jgi:hypothetical protein